MKIRANGFDFDALVAGQEGDPLILFLHGFPQTSHTWREQVPALAERGFFAVAPNQRGYSWGARPGEVSSYATENLVADALAMMDVLGYETAHIVGHDWGGQLSWLLAAHHPDRVNSLTVLSRPHPQAFLNSLQRDEAQAERSRHHKTFQNADAATLLLEDNARRLRNLFTDQGVPEVDQNAYLSILGGFDALDAAINWYRAPVQAGSDQPLAAGETPAVTVPVLYIWGDADAAVGSIAAEATQDYVEGPYRFERLPGIGHFITDEDATRVTELLLEFLGNTDHGKT